MKNTPSVVPPRLELFTASSTVLSARVIGEGFVRHIHSTVDPAAEESHFSELNLWGTVIICAGFGLGYHIASKLGSAASGKNLVIIEYYDELIEHIRDRDYITAAHSSWFISQSTPRDQYDRIRAALHGCSSGDIQVVRHPASYRTNPDFYEFALRSIVPIPPAQKCPPQAGGLLLYGNFFLQEELRRALFAESRQHPALLCYEEIHSLPGYASRLGQSVSTNPPRYILSINMKGFDGEGMLGEISRRLGIPVVVWFVDDPHPILLQQRQFVRDHFIALTWERSYIPFLKSSGFSQVHYLPLASDPDLMSDAVSIIPATPVGFVGSAMRGEFLESIRRKFLWDDRLTRLVRSAAEQIAWSSTPAREVLPRLSRRMGIEIPYRDERNMTWFCSYVIHWAGAIKRSRIIGALGSKRVEIFGDQQGWREELGSEFRVHPDVDYRSGIGGVYRCTAINLNITSCQMQTAVNQRVFDVPAAGGFVLSDAQSDLFELFDPEKEIVTYTGVEELTEKVTYYSGDESLRMRIARAARTRVLAHHTYVHRLRRIEEIIDGR